MSVPDASPDLLTLSFPEAAGALGISERTLRTLVSTRQIPYVKVGKFVRFKPAALAAWLEENTRQAVAG